MIPGLAARAASGETGRMKRLLAALLLASGCAASAPPPDSNEAAPRHLFRGEGEDPYWVAMVDEREIVLYFGPGSESNQPAFRYPGVRASTVDGVRRWEAGSGTAVIGIEAWDEACVLRGYDYRERARVRLSGRELNGCGGSPPVVEIR
jgi:uncharacterized membrane protein